MKTKLFQSYEVMSLWLNQWRFVCLLATFLCSLFIIKTQAQQLYGLTSYGGTDNLGAIIQYNTTTGLLTTPYSMTTSILGGYPYSTSLVEYNGKFYGLNSQGGLYDFGVIYEWDPVTNIYTKKIDLNGQGPIGGMTLLDGKFYGVTKNGGTNGFGILFEWDPNTNIYSKKIDFNSQFFTGDNGYFPAGNLTVVGGKLYGMTSAGGVNNAGTIFEWNPATSLYTKKVDLNPSIGSNPQGSLTLVDGKLYGMTQTGGLNNAGVLFEWDTTTHIYTKRVDMDTNIGANPLGTLTFLSGKLYGLSKLGGLHNVGTLFEWDLSTNICVKKIDFNMNAGNNPFGSASLTVYEGKLYGMTPRGGLNGGGTLFEWNPSTSTYTSKIDFSHINGTDALGTLTLSNGKLFGTTFSGGANNLGVIFEWNPNTNIYTKKIDFSPTIGNKPYGSLIQVGNKLYGMTRQGGENGYGNGVIFEWNPIINTYTKKFDFNGINGSTPFGDLTLVGSKLYGMTYSGGTNNKGVIFEWDPTTNTYTKKINLDSINGANPQGSLTLLGDKLYGMTLFGGTNNMGVIFEWNPTTNTYTKKIDLNITSGMNPQGSLTLLNGKFYGMTNRGGVNNVGVLFEWDPITNMYTKKLDFGGDNGEYPSGSLTPFEGKLYGLTPTGGGNIQNSPYGVIFEWDPITNIYTKKIDFGYENAKAGFNGGAYPNGNLTLIKGMFYGMTSAGGTKSRGVLFEWNPITNVYVKKADFRRGNGSNPQYGHLTAFDADPPTTPILSSSNHTTNSIKLSWTAAFDSLGVSSYEIYQGGNLINTLNDTTYTINGLNSGTSYNFFIKAKDAVGNSSPASNNLAITTDALANPVVRFEAETNYTVLNEIGTKAIQLRNATSGVSNNNAVIVPDNGDKIRISFSVSQAGQYQIQARVRSGTNTNSTYYFANRYGFGLNGSNLVMTGDVASLSPLLSAFGGSYFGTMKSATLNLSAGAQFLDFTTLSGGYGFIDYLEIINSNPDTQVPSIPTLSLNNKTSYSVSLTWTSATDNVGVVAYEVYQDSVFIQSVNTTSFTVSTLNANTTYNFTVKAKDAAGNKSPSSNTITVTTDLQGSPKIVVSTQELIFDGVKNTTIGPKTITIQNTGNAPLQIQSISKINNNTNLFTINGNASSINPGASLNLQISFVPGTAVGSFKTDLRITSNDTSQAITSIGLYGLSTNGFEGVNEPTLNNVVRTLGIGINVGWTSLADGTSASPKGDEILVPLFQRASAEAITITPVARYSPTHQIFFGYYLNQAGVPQRTRVGELLPNSPHHQTLFPGLTNGSTTFNIDNSVFGIFVQGLQGRFTYTEDALNAGGPAIHAARIYPMKDRNGVAIPNSYLICFEDASNGDYQDYMFVISNVIASIDTQAPSTPILSLQSKNQTSVSLNWTASSDNVGVIAYEVYQGASLIQTLNTTSYTINGLNPSTTYNFTVKAKDEAGNTSLTSNTLVVTTDAINNVGIRFEAETNYVVVNEIGTRSIQVRSAPSGLSNNNAVIVPDNGDKIRINFSIPQTGQYQIKVRVRSGTATNSTYYFANRYGFSLNGNMLSLTGNLNTISPYMTSFGGAYFGTMESGTLSLNAGSQFLDFSTLSGGYGFVDYLEVIQISTSAKMANSSQVSSQNTAKVDIETINKIVQVARVYPNPTVSESIRIDFSAKIEGELDYQIFNQNGLIIENQQIKNLSDDFIYLNLTNLNAGIYFIRLNMTNLITKPIKIIKQ